MGQILYMYERNERTANAELVHIYFCGTGALSSFQMAEL